MSIGRCSQPERRWSRSWFFRAWADLRESAETLHETLARVLEQDAEDGDTPSCCSGLLGGRRQPSPFTAVIGLGYYDGVTSGLAECGSCGRAYRFALVAWDGGQDVRVFAAASLPPGVFRDAVGICSRLGVPRRPVWVPICGDGGERVREALDVLLGTEPPADILFATSRIEEHILAAGRVPDEAHAPLVQRLRSRRLDGGEEWFRMLGLPWTDSAQ